MMEDRNLKAIQYKHQIIRTILKQGIIKLTDV